MPSQLLNLSDPAGSGDELVVVLHAYNGQAATMAHVVEAIRADIPDAELMTPELPLRALSLADPNRIVADLLDEVDRRWKARQQAKGGGHRSITLVGHSAGSLLARKLYVVACGEQPKAPFEDVFRSRSGQNPVEKRAWAERVDRIVLPAGMNRGWQISHHLRPDRAVGWWLGGIVGTCLAAVLRKQPFIFTVRRGATFITQLRIQWIRMRQAAADGAKRTAEGTKEHPERVGRFGELRVVGGASTVQLLGSIDDYVAPTDNIDLVSGGDFYYLDVPFSGHADVVEMDGTHKGRARLATFRQAIIAPKRTLARKSILPQDDPRQSPDHERKTVIFVVHGIRDQGHWTHKIARRVLIRASVDNRLDEFTTETSSYGFFPMLPFLFPGRRRERVEWLMDQYAQTVARYPHASFHYVGHSNGTYCLANALERYPCCIFDRVVFAGSVVRKRFEWHKLMLGTPRQVGSVLNYVATKDWVVAGFPKFFERSRWLNPDLGGAGHVGFVEMSDVAIAVHPELRGRMHEVRFVNGGHGAAIQEENWDAIAGYVYDGMVGPSNAQNQAHFAKVIGAFPPFAWLAAAVVALVGGGIVGGVAYRLVPESLSSLPHQIGADAVALTLAVVAGTAAVWKVVTKL